MKKSPVTKFFVIFVLVFFILSTGLMFVLYLASPSTIVDTENSQEMTATEEQENTIVIPDASDITSTTLEE